MVKIGNRKSEKGDKKMNAKQLIIDKTEEITGRDPYNYGCRSVVVAENSTGLHVLELAESAREVWYENLGKEVYNPSIYCGKIVAQAIRGSGQRDGWTIRTI